MRRLIAVLVLALAAACTDPAPPEAPASAVAEVEIPGAPNALTHGNDPLPPRPQALVAQVAPEAAWPCEGTGEDGRRVQMLYLHGPGTPSLSPGLRSTIEVWARQIEGMFLTSARQTGGERLVRFVTGPGCSLSILDHTVSTAALGSFDQMIAELRQQGMTRTDRAYHAFVEANAFCGIGTVYNDDRPTGNWNEQFAQYSRSDRPCWNAQTAAHEIIHNLGGVQNSAPNSTGGLHCRDEHDVMCYPDGAPRGQMVFNCPDPAGEDRLDCGHDDYFSTAPAAGSYLASHWNVADSSGLSRATGATTTLPPPTSSTTTTSTTSTTVGQGRTSTDLTAPSSVTSGAAFTVRATVSGACRPSGTVAFYVSGRLMSRQVLDAGAASVTLTLIGDVARPTIRADYSGSTTCAASSDSVRVRMR